jgi:hypothetical protein
MADSAPSETTFVDCALEALQMVEDGRASHIQHAVFLLGMDPDTNDGIATQFLALTIKQHREKYHNG